MTPEQAQAPTFTALRGTPAQVKWAGSLRAQCYSRLVTRFGVAHRLSLLGAVNRYPESWQWIDQHKGIESVIIEEMEKAIEQPAFDFSAIACEKCNTLGVVEEAMDVFVACLCQVCYEKLWAEYAQVMTAPQTEKERP